MRSPTTINTSSPCQDRDIGSSRTWTSSRRPTTGRRRKSNQATGSESSSEVPAVAAEASSIRRWLLFGGGAALVAGGLVYALGLTDAAHVERPVITAIAVLPLDNLSGDPSQEYSSTA